MVEVYEQLAKEKGIPNPLNKRSEKLIKRIIKRLKKQRLNRDFIIDESRYLSVSDASNVQTPPLPNMPPPRIMAQTQQKDPNTNLTETQQALLSPEEQIIASRIT